MIIQRCVYGIGVEYMHTLCAMLKKRPCILRNLIKEKLPIRIAHIVKPHVPILKPKLAKECNFFQPAVEQ